MFPINGFAYFCMSYKWSHAICAYLWFLSLNMMFSRFICVVLCISIPLFFIAKYSTIWIQSIMFVHVSTGGHLRVTLKTLLKNTATKIHVQDFGWMHFHFSEYIHRPTIAGSFEKSTFNILKNCQIVF